VRELVAGLTVTEVPVAGHEALDLDTPEDVWRARSLDM
jgi:CTP:molybdopterin cytidylyltransferase MocA